MIKINQEEFSLFKAACSNRTRVKVKEVREEAKVGIVTIRKVVERLGEPTDIKANSRVSLEVFYVVLKEKNPDRLKALISDYKKMQAVMSRSIKEAEDADQAPTVPPEPKEESPDPGTDEQPSSPDRKDDQAASGKEKPVVSPGGRQQVPPKSRDKAQGRGQFTRLRGLVGEKTAKTQEQKPQAPPSNPPKAAPLSSPTAEDPITQSPPDRQSTSPVKSLKTEEKTATSSAPMAAESTDLEEEKPSSYTQQRIREETAKISGPTRTGERIDPERLKPSPKKPSETTSPEDKNRRLKQGIKQQRETKRRQPRRPVTSSDDFASSSSDSLGTTWTNTDRPRPRNTAPRSPDWTGVRPKGRHSRAGIRRKRKKDQQRRSSQHTQSIHSAIDGQGRTIQVSRFITVGELAQLMDLDATAIIGKLLELGIMSSVNQRLEEESIQIIGEEFGFNIEFVDVVKEESLEEPDDPERLQARPPIVTVMGHVDHGKTSLLDKIRKTSVAAGEAGGITQHIGAYRVHLPQGQTITFIDTPGHEAFTTMRARGAKVTDVAVIVVAADDGVMPQTREALSHAKAADVDIVFAINKIDKPNANPDRIFQQLAEENFLVEAWGGDYPAVKVSAKTGEGIDELLETILAIAELRDLKADPEKRGVAAVLESEMQKGRGYVASILVLRGTIRKGDPVLVGPNFGRVRAMFDEFDQPVKTAGPSVPVQLLGLDGAPPAGEILYVTSDEQTAREIASQRKQIIREQEHKAHRRITLEEVGKRIAAGDYQELNFVIRGDTEGTVDALAESLQKLSRDNLEVRIIHRGVGEINEADVMLASASRAVIIGFNVRPGAKARQKAETENVQIRTYSVIYDVIEDVKNAIKGMLAPDRREVQLGTAEVKEIFKIRKIGTVAGCQVTVGKMVADAQIRLIRDGVIIHQTRIASLKHYKDEVKEIRAGMECGILLDGYNDVKVGDVLEAFTYEEVPVE